MPDDPKPDTSQIPPNPFSTMDVGAVAIVEMFRSYRRAGASRIDAAFIIGAHLTCGGKTDD